MRHHHVETPSKTLVLNQGYEPIRVVSWQRALKLFFLGKAEVLEPYINSPPLRSQHLTVEVPAVIRFTQKTKFYYGNIKLSRDHVLKRDNYRCQYCGRKFKIKHLTIDHVVPRSKGGRRVWTNLVAACFDCNQQKGDRSLQESGMKLLRKPTKPTRVAQLLYNYTTPEQWEPFLSWYRQKGRN